MTYAGNYSNSAYKTPPLVRYRRCASIGKCRSVRETCPLFGIRRCPLFGSCKCIASRGIAVGTSAVVRYSGDVRYWECPLSEVPLYIIIFSSCERYRRVATFLVGSGTYTRDLHETQGHESGINSLGPEIRVHAMKLRAYVCACATRNMT